MTCTTITALFFGGGGGVPSFMLQPFYILTIVKAIPLQLPDLKTVGTWWWEGCQPYEPAAFTPQEMFLVLISCRG
jgi:hypothetical protein